MVRASFFSAFSPLTAWLCARSSVSSFHSVLFDTADSSDTFSARFLTGAVSASPAGFTPTAYYGHARLPSKGPVEGERVRRVLYAVRAKAYDDSPCARMSITPPVNHVSFPISLNHSSLVGHTLH